MKRTLKKVLRKIYAQLMKNKFIRKRRKKIQRVLKKYRIRKLRKFCEKYDKLYRNVELKDTDFSLVEFEANEESSMAFGYDVLGQIRDLSGYDYIEFGSVLEGILSNEEIDVKIAYAENRENNKEAFDYLQEKIKLLAVSDKQSFIVSVGEFKAAIIGSSVIREGDVNNLNVDEQLIKNIVYAKRMGVNYILVYLKREDHKSTTLTSYERKYFRFLANLGCNAVFASNLEGIYLGRSIKRMNRTHMIAAASMGDLLGKQEEGQGAALVMRMKLLPMKKEERYIINRGYIPLYNAPDSEDYENLVRIDYHNGEHRRNEQIMNALEYIENKTNKIRDVRNILTIKEICDILGVDMPEAYAHLANASVGKVCARSFEVGHGDVLFFREPFTDPNDGEPKPLEVRLRVVDKALKRGARFIFSYVDLDESIPHVKIDNAREGHIKVCAKLREFYEVRTVGITGSVGKTSTKDMLYNVLNEKYKTYRNLRNSNTQVNIGMHIQNFRGGYEFFIQEIGGGRPGGASRHSRMILPEATVITNIGHAHIGNYGSQEKIMESKLGIIEGMDEMGTLFLNGDDPLLATAKVPADVVFYGVNNKNADYYADDIVEDKGKTYFNIVHGEKKIPAMLNVLGEYNVLNAVCCYAMGKKFGLTDDEIVAGIAKFETSGVRQNLITVAGYNLFVDCFNASPASMDSSLSVLDKIETDNKKIAVLGDVTGMAELSHEIHVEIGEIVKKHQMDVLVCYGEEARIVYDIAKEAGYNAYHITEAKELERFLMKNSQPGDVLLFKGSSKMLLAERIDSMFGTMLSDQRYIDGVKFKTSRVNRVTYNLYPEYATAMNSVDYNGKVVIERTVSGRPVYNLGEGAFSDKENITAVQLHNQIRHIGNACFHGCGMIKKIDLPNSVKYIGERAFAECSSLEEIVLQEGILHIADEAFKACTVLEEIFLPSSILQMGKGVFDDCDNLTVYCKEGSYAHQYCEENGVYYKLR